MFRINPRLPPQAVKTYAISAPIITHYRKATCQEVECRAHANGWVTRIDVSTELGARQAKYIREKSGRTFTLRESLPIVELTFPPGQQCFAGHHVPLERDAIFIIREGDFRGNPRGTPAVKLSAPNWTDHFMEHQDRIAKVIEGG